MNTPRIALAAASMLTLISLPVHAGSAYEAVKIGAGEILFDAECHRCHADNASDPSYGPSLVGIIGKRAGTSADYEYSEALANASFVWTPAALRAWMEDNQGFVPGTKMRHVGIEDRTVQDFILSYLGSIEE